MIITDILEEHLEEADFLWQQRENALEDRAYTLAGLAELEERLLAHLDGLTLGGQEAWALLEPKLAGAEPGEVFAAAFVALESRDPKRIGLIQKALSEANDAVLSGIRHALRHASFPDIEKVVQPLLASGKGALQAAAIDVMSFRRMDIKTDLLRAGLSAKDPLLIAASANAAGRLRRVELKRDVESAWENSSPSVRLESIKAGLLLNDETVMNRCRKAVLERSEKAEEAVVFVGLAGRKEDEPLLVDALGAPSLVRNAIHSLGLLGNVSAMEALIRCAEDPKLARPTGEAIRNLIGVDLQEEDLVVAETGKTEVEASVGKNVEERVEEEDEFEIDPDEDLPAPDPSKMAQWWQKNASQFEKGERYRKGYPYSLQGLMNTLQTGTLPERHQTSIELAMQDSSFPFLETRALAGRQLKEMERLIK